MAYYNNPYTMMNPVYNPGQSYTPYSQPVSYGNVPPAMNPQGQNNAGMCWVDGEVGAKAFQMPQGWVANMPIPLWDSTDTVIYLKSWNQMGIPNPLGKLRYEIIDNGQQALLTGGNVGQMSGNMNGTSGASGTSGTDMSQYVMKDNLEQIIRKEIREAMGNAQGSGNMSSRFNQNGRNDGQNQNQNNENRGGNRQ